MSKLIGKEIELDDLNLFTTQYKSGHKFSPHYDRHYRISIVLSGSLREESTFGVEEASPFSLVTKPASLKHSNCFGPYTTRLLSVEINPKLLEAPERNLDSLHNYNWLHANYSFQPVIDLLKAIYTKPEIDPGKQLIRERVELLLDTLADVPQPQDDKPPPWLRQIKQRLIEERHVTESVKALAASAGKHPTHLTRWFKRYYGCTVTAFQQRLRLKSAMKRISNSDQPLVEIALDSGFYDQSHFIHEFRKKMGLSPGEYQEFVKACSADVGNIQYSGLSII